MASNKIKLEINIVNLDEAIEKSEPIKSNFGRVRAVNQFAQSGQACRSKSDLRTASPLLKRRFLVVKVSIHSI